MLFTVIIMKRSLLHNCILRSLYDHIYVILLNKNKYMLTVWFLFNIRVLRLIVRTTNTTIVSVSLNLKGRVHETTVHDQYSVFSVQFSPEYSNQRQSSREPWVESNVRTADRNQTPQGSLTFIVILTFGKLK